MENDNNDNIETKATKETKKPKKQFKLYFKWAALAAFIGIIIYLQVKYGSAVRNAFCGFAGGMGMFMFGMKKMSNNLQVIAGDSLKGFISNLTRNTFMTMITGVVVTGLIQSSAACTVMVVGFVNSGLMTLIQAIGVILGANIGTTVTAQLIAFNLSEMAWPILAVGSAVMLVGKSKRVKSLGETIVGFSLMFLGMKFMGGSVLEYKDSLAPVIEILSHNRFYGIIAGIAATFVFQSSAATVGLVMSLAQTGTFGSDSHTILMTAVPIILGDNIGTCITAILASMGTSRNARRAAAAHLTFNACGTIIVLPILTYYIDMIMMTSSEPMRQIANAHSIFNIANVCIFLPLVKVLEKLVLTFIPIVPDELSPAKSLDKRMLKTPPIAVKQAEDNLRAVIGVLDKEFETFNNALAKTEESTPDEVMDLAGKLAEIEAQRAEIAKDLNQFLIYLSQKELSESMRRDVNRLIYVSKDCEIIASQITKMITLLGEQAENGSVINGDSKEEMSLCFSRITEIYRDLTKKPTLTREEVEEQTMIIHSQSHVNHEAREAQLQRIRESKYTPFESIVLLDAFRSLDSLLSSLKYLCFHVEA